MLYYEVMTLSLTLPKWFDAHTHVRQAGLIEPIIKSQLDMGCYAILAMPNTKPPVAKVHENDHGTCWSIEDYRSQIKNAGGDALDHLMTPLYITRETTAQMVEDGAKSGLLHSAKYYPPHGTTNADHGLPMTELMQSDVLKAMSDHGVILNIHGEEHGLCAEEYFNRTSNAEEFFYRERMPKLREKYPNLKIVCEHITTKVAVHFVKNAGDLTGATVTPQHLLYTVGHLIQGLKYHLFCLPVVKFDDDRDALRKAVIDPENKRIFAGTDSAAHTVKATTCGCAAGCFTGGIAPQLYAQAFEEAGLDLSVAHNQDIFKNFLCTNAPDFYGIPRSEETFTLNKTPQTVSIIPTSEGDITPLPVGLGNATIPWSISL
jgi:dihydroorotase